MSTFTTLDPANDKKENSTQLVTTGLWSGGAGVLSMFSTSSDQTASFGKYFVNVYQTASTDPTAEVQFSVGYGSQGNSGSAVGDLNFPAKAVYSQYAGAILAAGDSLFTVNGTDKYSCVFLNIQRNRFKEKVNRGTWQLTINGASKPLHLIDNSSVSGSEMVGEGGKVYHIVSGSYNTTNGQSTIWNASSPDYYGLFYPDIGILVLDYVALISGSQAVPIAAALSKDINCAFVGCCSSFVARSEENIKNSIYFIRVKNRDYNYSTNPTFFDTAGNILSQFINEPITYITSVGLYNAADELIAVAKLSSPIQKSQERELLLKCKLDF